MRAEPRIVCLGGGTGLSTVLRGLKLAGAHPTAIVTLTDDGGSSGRLRRDLGMPPPGDVRNCLVALADDESVLAEVFQHRFDRGDLEGHSLGNLVLAALTEVARMAGRPRSWRAAGAACAHGPLSVIVPYHRVIRADGSIGGYGALGDERKRRLLALEGARAR